MTLDRFLTTATVAAAFPVLLATTLSVQIQHAVEMSPLILAVTAIAAAAAVLFGMQTDTPGATTLALQRAGYWRMVTAAVGAVTFLGLQIGAYLLLISVSLDVAPLLLGPWWAVPAAIWLVTTLLSGMSLRRAPSAMPTLTTATLIGLGLIAYLSIIYSGNPVSDWTGPAIGVGLATVILGLSLSPPAHDPARRAINRAALVLATATLGVLYLAATIVANTRIGPGSLFVVPPTPRLGPLGPGPVTFPIAEEISQMITVALQGRVYLGLAAAWQWPLLAAIGCAVVLFGRAAIDQLQHLTIGDDASPSLGTRLAMAGPSTAILAVLFVAGSTPLTMYLLATIVGTIGLLLLACLTALAAAAASASRMRRILLAVGVIGSTVTVAAAMTALPLLTAAAWTAPVTWLTPAIYAITIAAALTQHRWRRRAEANTSTKPTHIGHGASTASWIVVNGQRAHIGDTVTVDYHGPTRATLHAEDPRCGLPQARILDGSKEGTVITVTPGQIMCVHTENPPVANQHAGGRRA